MKRTSLQQRNLPDYTPGEEIFNCLSHALGAVFGTVCLVLCLLRSAGLQNGWAVVSSAVYGGSMIALYTMSSVYHGLRKGTAKKVMQVIDHCTIYFLIGGSYTPVLLCSIRPLSPRWAWGLFALVWGLCVFATVFTAIDLKKYAVLSMCCYIGMGWSIVAAARITLQAVPLAGLGWLLAGGVAYTVGAVLYGLGKKRRYMHSVFHVFVLLGSALQFVCVYCYVLV